MDEDIDVVIQQAKRVQFPIGAGDISREQLQQYVSMVERGQLDIRRGPMWCFDQLPVAHQAMDENRANGKMVVVVR